MSSPENRDVSLDVDALLTIDFEEELRKLAQAQLNGPWQLPTELIRRAHSYAATEVEVTLGRGRLTVVDDGGPYMRRELVAFAALLDPTYPAARRHQALLMLERRGESWLIALAGCGAERITLITHRPYREEDPDGRRLEWRRGEKPRITRVRIPERETRFEIEGFAFDRRQARRWMEAVCRHCTAEIHVNGEPLPRGFTDRDPLALAFMRDERMWGDLCIPREGEGARVALLFHGVLTSHLVLPRSWCFEITLEMSRLIPGEEQPELDELREEATKHLSELRLVARNVLFYWAKNIQKLSWWKARRLRELVLLGLEKDPLAEEFRRAPLYRAFAREGTAERWLSLEELESAAKTGALQVLSTIADPARYLLSDGPVLVLDSAERSLLSRALGVSLPTPPPKPVGRSATAKLFDAVVDALGALDRLARRLRHPFARPLAKEALSSSELAFADALERQLAVTEGRAEVAFCAGRGPIRRLGRSPSWLLPRENEAVAACVHAWSLDPAWIYPAALMVLDGRGLPSQDLAEAWRSR